MAANTRDRLIEEASTLFFDHGFHSVGLDQILDAVGVTKTTFYNHFESKDALIVEILQRRDQVETAELRADMIRRGGDDPRARLLSLFDVLRAWFADPGFSGCVFMNAAVAFPSPNDPVHAAAAAHGANILGVLREFAAEAGASDPDHLARQFLVLLQGSLVARYVAADVGAADIARSAAEALLEAHLGATATRPAHR